MNQRIDDIDDGMDGDTAHALRTILEGTPAHHTTVGDLTCAVLRQAILSGVLAPGERIQQDAVAEALGVSRVPVRSALLQLEAEGLVNRRPHHGATVASLGPREIHDLYEARIVLELHAVRRAIAAMTPGRLARLEELAARLDREVSGDGFLETRAAFYRTLYAAGDNEVMVDTIMRLRSQVGRYWLRRRVVHSEQPAHARLLDFVRRRDADGACRWLDEHLREVADLRALPVAVNDGHEGPERRNGRWHMEDFAIASNRGDTA
jgi:DNA-binding GntR family transcriptional regulator